MFFRLRLLLGVLLLTSIISVQVHSQTNRLTGKVLNEKNEPLAGVSIKVVGGVGTTTDVSGSFSLALTAGKMYELEFTAIGYEPKTITDAEVVENQVNELNIVMQIQAKVGEGVVISVKRSSAKLETINSAIAFQKNTSVVAQVVSAEAIRRSPDKNTGEVLKRVPGTSLQQGKYLVVRGLADRYNQAMLNGILLSSTEPDRKTFSFDILPSAIIDNIIINKAFIPELPGEWAGGLIQVNTKDVPSKDFFSIQIGTGFNTQTIGKEFYTYQGSSTDWLGFDNGFRGLPTGLPTKAEFAALSPAEKAAFGSTFKNIWTGDKEGSTFIPAFNQSLALNGGFTKPFGKNNKLAAVLAVNYNRSNKRIPFISQVYTTQNFIPDFSLTYDNVKYNQEVLAGALANFTLQLGSNNKISIKNLLNVNTSNYITLRNDGYDYDAGQGVKGRELAFKANTFFNTQISGDHNLKNISSKLHWFGSFNILDQYIPDQRRLEYIQEFPNDSNSDYIASIGQSNSSQKSGSRYYGFLSDYNYTAGGDISKDFKIGTLNQSVKGGYFFQVKDRLFDSRPFSIYLPTDNSSLLHLSPDKIFAPENFGNGSDNKFALSELAGISYRYLANSILNAGFLQLDNTITEKIRVVWGLRVEDFDQIVGSVKQSDLRHVHTRVTDYLPGVNATYKINPKTNFRLSASQTVIRPEFRELSTFSFFDFDIGASVAGNTGLLRTKVSNFDLRYELYPRAGELFTLGFFYKYFDKPIEAYFNPSSGGASTYNFLNATEANSFGAELEFRKKLDFSEGLKNFTFQGNISYIYNRVARIGNDEERPMQGQSPYLLNFGLQYDLEKHGINTTLLFNQIGRRIAYVGGGEQPAIWENPRPVLDFQIAKKIFKNKGELKMNISDIINKQAIFYSDLDRNKKYDNADVFAIKRNYGTNFSFSIGYNF